MVGTHKSLGTIVFRTVSPWRKTFHHQAWLRGEGSRWGLSEVMGAGRPLLSLGVLHSVHADIPAWNFCWCFRSDTFNNALLEEKCSVTKSCLKRHINIDIKTMKRILMIFYSKLK